MGKPNFSDEFKRDAVVQITERGYPVAEVSQRLGVSPHSLYAWKKQFATVTSGDANKDAEIRQLKRELARVTEERDILKKSHRVFRQGCQVRYAFVAEHQNQFGVRAMCRCLAIQPSGFYAWRKAPLSRRSQEDARQIALIRQAWSDSGKVYGYRKLHDDLLDQGETCCPNRVARLINLAGIKAQIGYKRRPGSSGGRPSAVAANTLDRQFDVPQANRAWVTDITYIRTMEGFAYLAVVLDLYSRRVVGWSLQSRQTTDVVLQALHMAVWRRKPKNRCPSRTNKDILVRLVAKDFLAEKALPYGRAAERLGHIRGDACHLAGLDVFDLEVAAVGHRIDPLNAQCLHCRCCGLSEQAQVKDLVAHRLLGDQLVLHVDRKLDVVADPHFGHALHRAGVRIGQRDLVSAGAIQFGNHLLVTVALALDGSDLLGQLAVAPAGTATRRTVIVGIFLIKPIHVAGELLVGVLDSFGERRPGEVPGLIVDRLDARAVDRHELAPEQVELTTQHHELAEHRLEGSTVVAAEVGDGFEIWLEVP